MSKTIVYAVRVAPETQRALDAAAAAVSAKPRALAASFIEKELRRLGFLPKTARPAAPRKIQQA